MTGKLAAMIPVLLLALAGSGHAAEARRVPVAVPSFPAAHSPSTRTCKEPT